jgi:hypothetical protein
MKFSNGFALLLVLAAAPAGGATKEQALPDKELLKMMEFLREMEMIKQIEMMRDMHLLEAGGAQANDSASRKAAPATKKETLK